jgi:hypothetical protein
VLVVIDTQNAGSGRVPVIVRCATGWCSVREADPFGGVRPE